MTDSQPSGVPPAPAPPWRALLGRVLAGSGVALALLVLAVLSLRLPPVGNAFANLVLARVPLVPGATLATRETRGDWLTGVEFRGVRLAGGGVTYATADTVRLRYSLAALLGGRIHVGSAGFSRVVVDPRLFRVPRPKPRRPRAPLTFDDFLRGRFYGGPALSVERLSLRDVRGAGASGESSLLAGFADSTVRLLGIQLEARDLTLGRTFAFELDSLALRLRAARVERAEVHARTSASLRDGRLAFRDFRLYSPTSDVTGEGALGYGAADSRLDVGLRLEAAPLDLADLSAFVAAPDTGADSYAGELHARAELRGASLDSLTGSWRAELERGVIAGLRLGTLRITSAWDRGRAQLELDAVAEGAPVAVRGSSRPLDARPEYDLHVTASRLPQRLPGAPWWRAIAERAPFAWDVTLRGQGVRDGATELALTARDDSSWIALAGRVERGDVLAWEVKQLVLRDVDVEYLASGRAGSRVNGELRAHGQRSKLGRQRAAASVELGPTRYGRWEFESGRAITSFDESRGGASVSLASASGTLEVDTLTWQWGGSSPFEVRGARLRVRDLAAWSGNATLTGRLEADAALQGNGLAQLYSANGGARALRDGRVRARSRVTILPSLVRGRQIRSSQMDLRLAEGTVTLAGELDSDAGHVIADADARPFDAAAVHRVRRLRFERLDLGAWLGNGSLRSQLTGTLSGESRAAAPRDRSQGLVREWNATLEVGAGHVGPLAFSRASWEARGRDASAHASGRVDVRGGAIQLDADVRGAGEASTATARLSAPMALLPSLLGRDTLAAEGELQLLLETTGSFRDARALRAQGQLHGRGAVAGARLDSLALAFHLERGLVTVDTLALRSNVAAARASGRVVLVDAPAGGEPEPVARLSVQAEWRDPSLLAPLLGADTLSVASGGTRLEVSGPARDRVFTIHSDLRTLVWNDVRVKRAAAEARGRLGGRGRLTELDAKADAEWMTFGDLRVPALRLRLRGDASRMEWSGDGRLRVADSISVAGAFATDTSGWALALERFELRSDSVRWLMAQPTNLRVLGSRLELEPLDVRSSQGRVRARGVLDRAGTQDFHVQLEDVGLGVLTSMRDLGALRGRWSATLGVRGPAASPRAQGELRAVFESSGQAVGSLGAALDWTQEGMDLDGAFASPARDSLVLESRLPIAFSLAEREPGAERRPVVGSGRAEVRLRAARFPLAALQPLLANAGVGALAGTLDMDLRLAGRSGELRGEGRAGVSGGRLELPGIGLKASDLRLGTAWNGDRLVLQELHSMLGKGKLDASGSLRIASLTQAEPDLKLQMDRAPLVDTKQLKLVASGDLHVGGTHHTPAFRGRLSFAGSHLLVAPETFAGAEGKAVIPLSAEDLRTLEETFTYVEPVAPDPILALYDASDLDLTIVLDRNNWIRQTAEPRLSVEVFGEVRMQKKPGGEPELVGKLEPLPGRGYLEQFGRSFALTGGEVLLNGAMSAHTLNLRAQYPSERDAFQREENDVVVHLDLQGTLEKMRLVLSSEPALSETEIITFIATGRSPTTRSGQSQSLGSDAAKLGVDMGLAKVSGALEDVAQRSVGLDVLKVGYDGIQGTTLIAGRYVAPQLYVGFRQPLQTLTNSGVSLDEDTDTKVEMEYAAYRWLVLNVQGESSFIRSYLRFRREY